MSTILLKTRRLLLDPLSEDHLPRLLEISNEIDVRRYLWDNEKVTLQQIRSVFETSCHDFARHRFGIWAVKERLTDRMIGFCGLRHTPTDEIELLYGVSAGSTGKGYATESSRAVIRYAFDLLRLKCIVASANPGNIASWKILETIGMIFRRMEKNEREELKVYSMKRQSLKLRVEG
jgi:ribosomal-protein-alanine N-acetyltransferase